MAKIPTVSIYEVNETLLGGYTVSYKCPHCHSELKSKESEIGVPTECPKCGSAYGISRKASKAIELIKLEKQNESQIKLAAKEAKIPTCKECGKRASLWNRLVSPEGKFKCDECYDKELQEGERQRQLRLQQEKQKANDRMTEADGHLLYPEPPNVSQAFSGLGLFALVLGGFISFLAFANQRSFLEIIILMVFTVGISVSLFGWSAIIKYTHATAHFSRLTAIQTRRDNDS